MKHRTLGALLVTLAVNFLVAPLAAEAQPSTNVHRIGWLSAGQLPSGPASGLVPFRQGLRDLGYIEGQIILIEDRSAEGRDDRISDLASELVRLNVDVIVAAGSAAIRAASTPPPRFPSSWRAPAIRLGKDSLPA
jgi:putative ABC transport system substrate-binding protein